MRSSRLLMLAVAAVALAGCMQTGGPGPFSRNAPPLWQQDVQLPTMLRPAPVRTGQPSVIAQPAVVERCPFVARAAGGGAKAAGRADGAAAHHAASRRDGAGRIRIRSRFR